MDKRMSKIRSTHLGVLQKGRAKVRLDTHKLSQRRKSKSSSSSRQTEWEDNLSSGFRVKENDSMETSVLVFFWGVVIIVAEIAKWVAAFHFAKHLPWIKTFMGGH